jgi:hypothetical protein
MTDLTYRQYIENSIRLAIGDLVTAAVALGEADVMGVGINVTRAEHKIHQIQRDCREVTQTSLDQIMQLPSGDHGD